MSRDPLDLLGDLPDWPGKTPPRNRDASKKPITDDALNGARSKIYKVNGLDREFFTVGELARALGRKPVTVRAWEQRGWIPKVKYRTPPPQGEQLPGKVVKGRRLYTKEQVLFLVEGFTKFKIDTPKEDWDGLRQHIRANWPAD